MCHTEILTIVCSLVTKHIGQGFVKAVQCQLEWSIAEPPWPRTHKRGHLISQWEQMNGHIMDQIDGTRDSVELENTASQLATWKGENKVVDYLCHWDRSGDTQPFLFFLEVEAV